MLFAVQNYRDFDYIKNEFIFFDRGPFITGRIIDLSRSAARKPGFIDQGIIEVQIEIINKIPKKVERLSAPADITKIYSVAPDSKCRNIS